MEGEKQELPIEGQNQKCDNCGWRGHTRLYREKGKLELFLKFPTADWVPFVFELCYWCQSERKELQVVTYTYTPDVSEEKLIKT